MYNYTMSPCPASTRTPQLECQILQQDCNSQAELQICHKAHYASCPRTLMIIRRQCKRTCTHALTCRSSTFRHLAPDHPTAFHGVPEKPRYRALQASFRKLLWDLGEMHMAPDHQNALHVLPAPSYCSSRVISQKLT